MAKKTLPTKRRIFNLLKPYRPPPNTWDKIYDWLLNRARVIMVLAEIIVVVAFVTKVVVDVQAKSLDDQIESAQATLGLFSTTAEPTVRKIQQKSSDYAAIWDASSGYSRVITEINSYIQNPSADIVIRITDNKVSISGGSNISDLAQIEARMKSSPTFTNVTLPTLSTDSGEASFRQGQYVFNAEIVGDARRTPISAVAE